MAFLPSKLIQSEPTPRGGKQKSVQPTTTNLIGPNNKTDSLIACSSDGIACLLPAPGSKSSPRARRRPHFTQFKNKIPNAFFLFITFFFLFVQTR